MNLTLDDIYEYLQEPHRYEHYIMACCEYHDDIKPSMLVTQGGYKCKSCNAHGTLEKLYQRVSGRVVIRKKVPNPSAYLWVKWEEKFGSIQNIAKIAHQNLINNPDLGCYLQQRKVDGLVKSCLLGYMDGYYTFPILNEFGEIKGITARVSPTMQLKRGKYTTTHDCPVKFYVPSWRTLLKNDELYLVYGIIDSLSLLSAGYAGFSSLTGQSVNPEWLEQYRKTIYIIPDKGEESSALELQAHLGWRGKTLFIDWPETTKDLNQIHQEYGLDMMSSLIEKSKEKYHYD